MADRPVLSEEIEITPQMIEAARDRLWDRDPLLEFAPLISHDVLSDVISAVIQQWLKTPPSNSSCRSEVS